MLTIFETKRAGAEVEDIASRMLSNVASIRFVDEVRETYQRIARMPTLGSEIEELRGTKFESRRRCTVRKFRNYIVFYSFNERQVVIHHVFDGRRNYLDLFDDE